jgi:hypothetical protein
MDLFTTPASVRRELSQKFNTLLIFMSVAPVLFITSLQRSK